MSIVRLGYKKFGIGYVLIVFSLVFLIYGIKAATTEDVYMPVYVLVQAEITDKSDSPDQSETVLTLSYEDLSGNTYSRKLIYNGSADVGDVIEIRMNRNNPKLIGSAEDFDEMVSEHSSGVDKTAVLEIIAGAVLLIAGVILLVRRIRREKLTRLLEEFEE